MSILSALLIALVVPALVLSVLLRLGERRWLQDQPNHRSLHSRPVPRFGGIAIVLGLGGGVALLWCLLPTPDGFLWLCSAATLIVLVSLADDAWSLPVGLRLVAHSSAAVAVVAVGLGVTWLPFPGGALPLGIIGGSAFSLLFVVWMINLYNFMDGLDGLAAGMTGFGFSGLCLLCWLSGDNAYTLAWLCAIVAVSVVGFWWCNFPPARVFMGDSGASVLGFLAAVFCLWAERLGAISLWVSLILFSPFIVDATVTLLWRAWRRETLWQAHRSHCYQRLVGAGYSHRQVVIGEYLLMSGCVLLAVVAHLRQAWLLQWGLLGALAVIYALLIWLVHRVASRHIRTTSCGTH